MGETALGCNPDVASPEGEATASLPAGATSRLAASVGVATVMGGVAALARLVLMQGWLWFIAAPIHALVILVWLASAGALTWWSHERCNGRWRRFAMLGLALIGASLIACVVVLVGGSARLVYRLATADV